MNTLKDEKEKDDRRRIIGLILLLICATSILIGIVYISCLNKKQSLPTVEHKNKVIETTSELDFTPRSTESREIKLPSTNGLVFKAGVKEQEVDFYNPAENKAIIQIDIVLSDGTIIYQSNYLKPDERINQIELTQTLKSGVYRNCKMKYYCYALDGETKLNSAEVKIEINSI
jgi:hypothetical protein